MALRFPGAAQKLSQSFRGWAITSNFAMAENAMIREGMLLITKIPQEPRATKLDQIIHKLNDPDFNVGEIQRDISFEIAAIIREGKAGEKDRTPAEQARMWQEIWRLIKALRQLAQQTREASLARQRGDSLDLHGPKFLFVLGEISRFFDTAMKDVKIDEHQRQNAIRHLHDILITNEEGLIRALKQMDRQPS